MGTRLIYLCYILLGITLPISVVTGEKEKVSITTKAGTFVGYVYRVEAYGKKLAARRFLAVPYAEPPIGELRFKKPKRKATLTEPHDATEYGASCLQQLFSLEGTRKPGRFETIRVSEDCLFINIYTPHDDMDSTKALPVMVYYHGGGFVSGGPNIYASDILAAQGNVIVVMVTYRVSVWGFLSTGDDNLPGNYGLWDQQMAIQWVHDNIAAFGGDPDGITLFGTSAGGASVVYHALYPPNKGLFKRVIAKSGTINCPWAYTTNPLKAAKRLGSIIGCNFNGKTKDLAACLQSKSSEELFAILNDPVHDFIRFPMEFVVSVDGEYVPEPLDQLLHGTSDVVKRYRQLFYDVDLLIGIVGNEGLLNIIPFAGVGDTVNFETSRERFETELVPNVIRIMFGEDAPKILNDLVINEYTDWSDPDNAFKTREAYIQLCSDYTFNIQNMETVMLHAANSKRNTFMYVYDAFPSQRVLVAPPWVNKPQHCDDLTTLLGYDNDDGFTSWTTPYPGGPPKDWELELSKAHIAMWTNFARTGDPNKPTDVSYHINTTWPQFDAKFQRHLTIDREMSDDSIGQRFAARAVNFWRNVLPAVAQATRAGKYDAGKHAFCGRDDGCEP